MENAKVDIAALEWEMYYSSMYQHRSISSASVGNWAVIEETTIRCVLPFHLHLDENTITTEYHVLLQLREQIDLATKAKPEKLIPDGEYEDMGWMVAIFCEERLQDAADLAYACGRCDLTKILEPGEWGKSGSI